MKYMGSKSRITKDLVPIIQNIIDKNLISYYVEPFVGGSNMIEKINCNKKIGSDGNKYLIEFMKRLQQGWNPLKEIEMTKQLYDDIKNNKDKYAPEIVALAGLCATYNAKWFGGYAGIVNTKIGTTRNYYDESVRNVLRQIENLKDVYYFHKDFNEYYDKNNECATTERFLFYCDPPYESTTKYKDNFDHEKYWEWVRNMSKKHIVLCSEYNAPADFECIWSKDINVDLNCNRKSNDESNKRTEKLFVLNRKGI